MSKMGDSFHGLPLPSIEVNCSDMSRSANEIIKAVQRGLAGHLTFVAATKGWGMTSELALYPTIGAVLLAREWEAYCQRKVPGLQSGRGAPSTIDFFARSRSTPQDSLAMEVKLLANGSRSKKSRGGKRY